MRLLQTTTRMETAPNLLNCLIFHRVGKHCSVATIEDIPFGTEAALLKEFVQPLLKEDGSQITLVRSKPLDRRLGLQIPTFALSIDVIVLRPDRFQFPAQYMSCKRPNTAD